MKVRLLRALQLGGCAARQAGGQWSIWRSTDRRGRIIGELGAADVEILRLNGDLAQHGDGPETVLVWAGPIPPTPSLNIRAPRRSLQAAPLSPNGVPLLQRLLGRQPDAKDVRRLAQAARDYIEDVTRANQSGRTSGMNWLSLAAGTRIDGAGRAEQPGERIAYAAEAAQRLRHLQAVLSAQDNHVLHLLLIKAVSRHRMSRALGLSPVASERTALGALSRLARAYDNEVTRPRRSSRPVT